MESRLPMRSALTSVPQNSRLQAPASVSKLKPPSKIASKRSRSPEEAPSAKRQRTSQENLEKKFTAGNKLRPSSSTGSLTKTNKPAVKKLTTQTSGGNIRAAATRSTTSNTVNKRPVAAKPPAKTGNAAASKRPTGNVSVSKRPTATENHLNASVASQKGNSAASTGGSKKRPAWDLKGRLQDMEQHMKQREQQMTVWSERIGLLENKNIQLSGTVAEREEVASSVGKAKEFLQQKLAETESELHSIKTKLDRETENFEFTKATLRRQKEALESELHALQTKAAGLETSIAQLTSAQAGLKSELTSTQVSLNKALNEGQEKDEEIARLTGIIEDNTNTIADYEHKAREFETDRRKLHNTIQELKGNIRVFCRIRPLIGDELYGNDGEIHHMNIPDDDEKTIELEKLSDVSLSESTINGTKRAANGRYTFSFDRIFSPDSTQSGVFEEISQLVQSALDGYNVCIFAYGQTGSGKTYTMEGPSVEGEETMGMISRSLVQIFNSTRDLEESGWQYEFEASFLEIYNETIRDLLGSHAADVKHDIKLGTSGKDVTVTNLTTQQVTRREQIVTLLRTASKNRAVGETQCNERSSRSHSVFRLKITGSNEITGENSAGTLNLIDLAGSERLKDSGATGQRLKETQNINKSLATLGNVIMALGNKDSFVPYRNSKLTFLLQNSLGGNSKTLMFVNVSPREEHFSETVNSLRFATKVNQCNIGTATKKTK